MTTSRDDLSLELRNNLLIGVSIGVIGGGAVGLLMTVTTLFLNPGFLGSFRDLLVLTAALTGVYVVLALALGLAGALLKTALYLVVRRRLSDTKTAAFAMGSFFFLLVAIYGISWCRWNGVGGANREEWFTLRALPVYLVVLATSLVLSRLFTYAMYVLVVYWKKPHLAKPGDWKKAFFVLAYVAAFTLVFMVVMRATTTPPRGEGGLHPADVAPWGESVAVLGLDGMTLERLEGMIRDMDAPVLQVFLREAARIRLDPGEGLIPPIQWTSLVTGQTYRRHGIADYKVETLRGLRSPLIVRPGQVGLYEAFNHVLPFFRLTRSLALRSQMRQTKALWNLMTEVGRRSLVVGWWATWPAEKIRGAMISDHSYLTLRRLLRERGGGGWGPETRDRLDGETYPPTLLLELAPIMEDSLREAPAGIPLGLLNTDRFHLQAALALQASVHPDLTLLYLPGPDVIKRMLAREDPEGWRSRFPRRARAYLETLLRPLEAYLETPATYHVLIVLPGWKEEAADGWMLLRGPGIRSGEEIPGRHGLPEAAATLIHLLGLPVAWDLGGGPVLEALQPEFAAARPLREVETYGYRTATLAAPAQGSPDEEMLERLRSLGYIGGP
jgi:hypothetical protein